MPVNWNTIRKEKFDSGFFLTPNADLAGTVMINMTPDYAVIGVYQEIAGEIPGREVFNGIGLFGVGTNYQEIDEEVSGGYVRIVASVEHSIGVPGYKHQTLPFGVLDTKQRMFNTTEGRTITASDKPFWHGNDEDGYDLATYVGGLPRVHYMEDNKTRKYKRKV